MDAPDSLCGVPVAMRGGRVITLAQLETPIIPINMSVSYLIWRMVSLRAQLQPLRKIFLLDNGSDLWLNLTKLDQHLTGLPLIFPLQVQLGPSLSYLF